MYKSYSFNTVNIESGQSHLNTPVTENAPLPNGLSSNPQVITLGADAVHTNVPDSGTTGTTPEDKPKMPTWVWYVAAAAILFVLLKK